jgi:prephenate dehydrogenase
VTGSVLVVGTGLIGTSIGLALQGERRVALTDIDDASLQTAVDRGAGEQWDGGPADVAVVAVPPGRTAAVLADLVSRNVAPVLTHVASCQSAVQRDLLALGVSSDTICGGHPLAGRELTGPAAATADLFSGRPWAVCPLPPTSDSARLAVVALATACGAQPVEMSPGAHDRAVALTSHLPQMAASAVAAQLLGGDASLAGPGLQDTTRIAASSPDLWVDILSANAAQVAPLVARASEDLRQVAAALEALAENPTAMDAAADVRALLQRGADGRARVPVKRGVLDRDVAIVAVRIPDRPGSLVQVLGTAALADINVEDVRVEHLPGRPTGVVELLVQSGAVAALSAALTAAGLEVLRSG